jgi:hypothetical protein
MDLQKTITGGTAAIAVGTASMVGGGAVVDKVNDGPAKRQTAVPPVIVFCKSIRLCRIR